MAGLRRAPQCGLRADDVTPDRQFKLYLAIGIPVSAVIVIAFFLALTEAHAGEIATALATVIGGAFVLAGAAVAWKGVQDQIALQRSIESDKHSRAKRELENALTAELLVLSRSIIDATSMWNVRGLKNPTDTPQYYPKLVQPRVYLGAIPQLGLLEEGWPAMAVITFFGNVLELNDIADETLRGRPSIGESNARIAERFRMMALNLEQALDGLNADRKFPLIEVGLDALLTPLGTPVSQVDPPVSGLQSLLAALGGRPPLRGAERS
jgi:hypothetical protein